MVMKISFVSFDEWYVYACLYAAWLPIGYSPRSSTFLAVIRVEAEGRGFLAAKNGELWRVLTDLKHIQT